MGVVLLDPGDVWVFGVGLLGLFQVGSLRKLDLIDVAYVGPRSARSPRCGRPLCEARAESGALGSQSALAAVTKERSDPMNAEIPVKAIE